jgi:ElaB/YqjD/DUF883 family membrane-anchored ribosome-binding protein
VAKKKTAKRSSGSAATKTAATDGPQQDADRSPRVQKAAEAVRRVEAELEKAQQHYRKVRQEATDRLKAVREKSLGDLIDGTLEVVKRHPGPGVIVAALIGFFLGRLFRR